MGRSEPVYTYERAERELSFTLKLIAQTESEFDRIYEKMEHLTSLCYPQYIDEMEKCLWEIKDEYDLPTEEIVNVVQSKRKNIDHIHKILAKKNK